MASTTLSEQLFPRPEPVAIPAVTLVIPCRNEEAHIAQCLDSILANDSCHDRVEILVVDAMSTDHTRAIIADYQRKWPHIRILDNPQRLIPAAMNIGLRHALGQLLLKIDAHSAYPSNYVSRCVEFLKEFRADNAGGVWKILPGNDSLTAKAIALSLSHPFASGDAYVKVGAKGPRWSDSAAFGCWKKDLLKKMGGWNEKLAGSSDMDLNERIRSHGGRILLVPDIVIHYYADTALRAFWKHNFADGVWATYVLKFGSKGWSWRHWVPLAFVGTLLGCLLLSPLASSLAYLAAMIAGAYATANLAASLQIGLCEHDLRFLPVSFLAFATRHLAHGLGALLGLLLVLLPGEHWKGRRQGTG